MAKPMPVQSDCDEAQIVAPLAGQLEAVHGHGFDGMDLQHMQRVAEVFEGVKIVYALSRQLGWTRLCSLIFVDGPLKREFYLMPGSW